jgi:hypothetical protein
MRKILPLLGLLSLLWLTACQGEGGTPGAYSGTLVLDGLHVYDGQNRLPGLLAILGGQVQLAEGGEVNGPVFLLGGELTLDGQISGDVSAIGGSLVIGPQAQIHGDLRAGSGEVLISPDAQVTGQILVGAASGIELDDLFPERSRREHLLQMVPQALLLAVFAFLGMAVAPRNLIRVSRAATRHPLICMSMGTLVGIAAPALLVVMAYTLILIPVTLIGILLGILVVGFGQIALGTWTGRLLERLAKRRLHPRVSAFLGAFSFRVILSLLALIPAVGSLVELLAAILSVGAVTLTRFGLREFVPENVVEGEAASP